MAADMTIQQALQLAMQHHQCGRLREAETLYRQVLTTQPNQPDALHLLGAIALDAGDASAAVELISRAIAANPSAAVYHGNLGLALLRMGRLHEAIASLQRALSLSAGRFPDAWFNLGNALRDSGQLEGAVDAYQHALTLQPAHRNALNNLGNALHLLGRLDEAMAVHHKTLELAPDWPLARYNLGITLLFQGDFERGWAEYEQRLAAPELPLPAFNFHTPRWDGSDLNGKRILIYSDQGFGDAFFSMRYIPLIAQESRGHVIIACQSELERLSCELSGVSEVVTQVDASVQYDLHAAMMSMPFLLKSTLGTIPRDVPYIFANPQLHARWQARLAAARGIKIGIAWSGRAYPVGRSIPIEMLAKRLKCVQGATFVNLQKGASPADLQAASQHLPVLDLGDDIADFADTAALIDNLDLVISVDTAVAHLAGAMGKPTWVLLQHVPDWRWLMDREDSPWYPTMRLFRQSSAGDWSGVLARVVHELRNLLGTQIPPESPEELNDLGNALKATGRVDEAVAAYESAARLQMNSAEIQNNLGSGLLSAGRTDAAIGAYEHAIAMDPQLADAHYGLSLALLRKGDYQRGFVEHEWRWHVKQLNLQRQQFVQPEWDGGDLNGRRILVYAEQGFGDTIQFARFLPHLSAKGGTILLACRPELVALMRNVAGVQTVLTTGDPTPAFDVHCPLLSLPRLLRTTLQTIPWSGPYLRASADRIAHWRQRVQSTGRGMKVGLSWAGRTSHSNDRNRSIRPDDFSAIRQVHGATFFSLQKNAVNYVYPRAGLIDWTPELHDFAETAALIESLDLVITVDTAVAHLAGALGKETWILLPYDSDWRWLVGRSDSPWYPSMRLFRQPAPHEWQSVVRDVARELAIRSCT